MARKPPQVYNVVRAQDGALVVIGVPLGNVKDPAPGTALYERARLAAEARVQVDRTVEIRHPDTNELLQPSVPIYAGMFHGQITEYEVRDVTGAPVA
jgi:hypothetical protein